MQRISWLAWVVFLASVAACGGGEDGEQEEVCVDLDGDGYGAGCDRGTDCNDDDSAIYENCPTECQGCQLDEVCISQGELHPDDPCQICKMGAEAAGFEAVANGTACDDGSFCSGRDACLDGVCSDHDGFACADDGVFCNGPEICDEEFKACRSLGKACGDGLLCSEVSKLCEGRPGISIDMIEGGAPGVSGTSIATIPGYQSGRYVIAACTGRRLDLYWFEGSWQVETIAHFAANPQIRALANQKFHLVYTDTANKALVHAYGTRDNWTFTTITEPGSIEYGGAQVVADDSIIHVAYTDPVTNDLYYINNRYGSYQIQKLPTETGAALGMRMTQGKYGMAFVFNGITEEGLLGKVYYLHATSGGGWRLDVVEGAEGFPGAIQIGPDNRPHILVHGLSSQAYPSFTYYTKYLYQDWTKELVYQGMDCGTRVFMWLVIDRLPRFVYRRLDFAAENQLYLASRSGDLVGTWEHEQLTSGKNIGEAFSVDSSEILRLVYTTASTDGTLVSAFHHPQDGYSEEILAQAKHVGSQGNDAVLDDGALHVSYFERQPTRLRYATNASGEWQSSLEDENTVADQYSSIQVSHHWGPTIAYYDTQNKNLMAIEHDNGNKTIHLMDDGSSVGQYVNLELFSDDAQLVYWDQENQSLLHLTADINFLYGEPTLIGTAGTVSGPIDFRLLDGHQHMVYRGSDPEGIYYYSNTLTGIHIDLAADDPGGTSELKLSLDSQASPHIAFYGYLDHKLRLSKKDHNGFFITEELFEVPSADYLSGLTFEMDSQDHHHIAFLLSASRGGRTRLYYLTDVNGTWQASIIDDAGWTGQSPVLLLDNDSSTVHLIYGGSAALWHTQFAMGYTGP